MSFVDVLLPTKFSEGSSFGPGFNNKLLELKSGAVRVVQGWPQPRRRLQIDRFDTLDELIECRNFFITIDGMVNTFRVWDPTDHATTPSGRTWGTSEIVTETDEVLVAVPGTTTQFQFVKRYTNGVTTKVRILRLLVVGTVLVSIANALQTTDFTINHVTGIVTFDTAPVGTVRGGAEFHNHGRFAPETDQAFLIAVKNFDNGEVPTIEIIEEVDPAGYNENFDYRGFEDHGDISAPVQLDVSSPGIQRVAPTTSGKQVWMPDPTEMPDGDWFTVINDGTQSVQPKTVSGGTNIGSVIASGASARFILGTISAVKTWKQLSV